MAFEHRVYLPMVGLVIGGGALFEAAFVRWARASPLRQRARRAARAQRRGSQLQLQ